MIPGISTRGSDAEACGPDPPSGAITIYGLPDPTAPTLQQVVNADPATWAALSTSQYP